MRGNLARMKSGGRVWVVLAGLAFCSSAAALSAQQEVPSTSTTSSTPQNPPPIQPIAVPDIARQSEQVATRLGRIESSLAPDPRVQEVASQLDAEARRLDEYRRAARDPAQLSLRELNEADRRWESAQGQIDAWLAALETRTTNLQAMLSELRRLDEVWAATERAVSADVPATVRASITEVRSEIRRVQRATERRLGDILTLQSRLAEQSALARSERTRLEEATVTLRGSLLSPDAPPLWSALAASEDRKSLAQEARDSWRLTATSIGHYVRSNPSRFAAQALIFVALLWVLTQLHRRGGADARPREELSPSARALSHPFANAALVTMLLTRLVHPLAPPGFYELNRLALLAPLLAILPSLVFATLRVPLYGLAVLYVFDLAVDFLPAHAQLARLLQLALAGAAFLGVLHVARPAGSAARLELGAWWRAARVAARLAAVLLAVAVTANLFGLLRLSSLLTDATLSSAYTAVVLFAGTLVLKSLLTLLLKSRPSQSFQTFREKGEYLGELGIKLLHAAALVSWVALTLSSLSLLNPLVDGARSALSARVSVGELQISAGDVLAFAVTIWLAFVASRVARVVLEEDVLPRFSLPRGVPGSVSKLAHYTIVLIGLFVALAASGIEMSRFALLAGAFGVGIGFGLQNIVNNFVSGLILLFERPIQAGDTIELEALFGTVTRIGIRSSTVRTFEGAEVIVPNAHLIESQVVNWTFSDRLRRIEVTVGVAYGSRPQRVLDTLCAVAREHPEILDQPEPYALFEGFGDSSLDFILRGWTANFDAFLRIRSELRVQVHDALREAGFEIPFPQRDLHVKSLPEHGNRRPLAALEVNGGENEKESTGSPPPDSPEKARAR